ncbi:EAL domain-containing protein [Pseudarthrobacter sp. S9]|uniref:EAL domain-containing protein n=1 Tax=Pseudarthrobacter sp. S9 TaxID=3418421 RepID=UPI003D027477
MSMEPSFFPGCTDGHDPADPSSGTARGGDALGLHRQVSAIIEAVLSDPAPGQAGARENLRKHISAHPGHPERALLEHLISLRSPNRFPASDPGLPTAAASEEQPPVGMPAPGPESVRSRIEAVLAGRMLLTAFQPIHGLSTGAVIGAEALTRFITDGADTADYWFAAAGQASLGSDLEFAALESALAAARQLPAHVYVALKLSPATCLDPLLPGLLERSTLSPGRTVLELTEALTLDQPDALLRALAPLRQQGVRLAIDHAGSYFGSIRHISHLRPDIIKLDRNVISGIDSDTLRHALGEAMAGLAEQIGAALVAEGIETSAELATVTGLGMTAGQGYFLGRPTTRPQDWTSWHLPPLVSQSLTELYY